MTRDQFPPPEAPAAAAAEAHKQAHKQQQQTSKNTHSPPAIAKKKNLPVPASLPSQGKHWEKKILVAFAHLVSLGCVVVLSPSPIRT